MRRRFSPLSVYLALRSGEALCFSLIFTVDMIYQVTVVGLSPLQLVLVGTILEATVFLFEIPTGVLADLKSRRLSVVIGYALIGLGFVVEGARPAFWAVVVAQFGYGLGYTFTSGATEAWLSDEIGEQNLGEAFLRGSKVSRVAGLIALPLAVVAGSIRVQVPVVIGGAALMLLAAGLWFTMSEEGFAPTPAEERTTWQMMAKTLTGARAQVARQPTLLFLLGIGLFWGLYSEGYDRLWTKHILEDMQLGFLGGIAPVIWISVSHAVGTVVDIVATHVAQRRVDTSQPVAMGRALAFSAAGIVLGLAGFALTRSVWAALACSLFIGALRTVSGPLQSAWMNLRIDDPQVRATVLSASGQVDAIGQVAGGPLVGVIGQTSVRLALLASAGLLAPVVPLYRKMIRSDNPVVAKDAPAPAE